MRVAFTSSNHHICLDNGKGHISRISDDETTIHFEYDDSTAKVTKVITPGAELTTTHRSAISGAIRRHKRSLKLASEVNLQNRE